MNILLIGSGAREHALAWKISQSPKLTKLFAMPGSAAISRFAECVNLNFSTPFSLLEFAQKNKIALVIVGPEAPLVKGLADAFQKIGIPVFGPLASGARLEASKAFTKNLCKKYQIPTAAYECFEEANAALSFLKNIAPSPENPAAFPHPSRGEGAFSFPIVIKADGLAAGKGVVICEDLHQASEAIESILVQKTLGEQNLIVIEEFLRGEEASFMVISDGKTYLPLATSQDHKRVFDGDQGPNTGGMGAYSPAPVVTPSVFEKTLQTIIEPTLAGLKTEGIPYQGVLYAGLMIEKNTPELLEYNVRFGDPECEVILPRMKSDLIDLMLATVEGKLSEFKLEWHEKSCVGVVLAAEAYPASPVKGDEIFGLDEVEKLKDVVVFHGGTVLKENKWFTHGGRVLVVSALGDDLKAAQLLAYEAVAKICWRGMHYRKDIAAKALVRK
ncbi:MAG: phosphoribosylamine--glycine ligase [Deltaproteobacteria bacterium]|nr:phosphoribosylamine--glycine ligase [Deltaproteobacteria bacterium]